jgi:four helix bundle protein
LLTKEIYIITKEFPDNEKFGIINQMRRAAISVSSNIAEGSSRTSNKDQAHFYQLAYSSLMELLNQAIISNDLEYFSEESLNETRTKIEKIANMLNALRKERLNR